MSIEVKQIDKSHLNTFIKLPFKLYKKDPNWVPPLIGSMRDMLNPQNNSFLRGDHAYFVAYQNKKPVARILAGHNLLESQARGEKRGFFSLFEAQDEQSAKAVLQAAQDYLKQMGMQAMKGPFSPTGGEERRALLVEGFESPPVLYASYNPEWYRDVFVNFGFKNAADLLGFRIETNKVPIDKFRKIVEYAKRRYGFEAYPINMKNLDDELLDIQQIINGSDTRDWGSGIPGWDVILQAAQSMKAIADPDLIYIVRQNDNTPIALVVSIPNYNEALIHTRGRMFPFGIFKFLYYKKRIKGVRVMMQFCVKEFEGKAAVSAAYLGIMETALKKGYEWGDASTIGEHNYKSWRPVVAAGGKQYRRFRYFEKNI
jgi:hypothetical protein